ncbi:Fibrinogen-like protein A [Holothuria leucospilota]|uniref:Fibrinogen-like protein A n=1 Tax=Holothuria leucospilota TaxID=206669 RepID=A0A9Q1CL55_HOLLE|nr:Fibrinogen-like protein A [Holothuria leucospilota]
MEFVYLLVMILSLKQSQVSSSDSKQFQLREVLLDPKQVDHDKGRIISDACLPMRPPPHPRDCSELQSSCPGQSLVSGEYTIQPDHYPSPFLVYCDFDSEGEAWTVIQRRMDGSVNFQRNWHDYREGFGFLKTEFWLGNEKLSFLTAQNYYELRIELHNQLHEPYYAAYNSFRVGDESMKYRLILGSHYTGNATNSLRLHNMHFFTTFDADHDVKPDRNCASETSHGGGWWFHQCDECNLNGAYGVQSDFNPGGIEWNNLPGGGWGLTRTEMKIRRVVSS